MGDEPRPFGYLPPDLGATPQRVLALFPDAETAAGFINWCQAHGFTQSYVAASAYLAGYNAARDVAEASQYRPSRTRPITL